MLASEFCEIAEQHMEEALTEIRKAVERLEYLMKQQEAVRKNLGIEKDDKMEELREKIAELLAFHVGTPTDSYGTTRKQPDWCCPTNCLRYSNECESCIAAQIVALIKDISTK